jgi:hypothetical protein
MRNPDRGGASIGTIGCAPAEGESRSAKTACYANAIPYVAVDDSPKAFRKENRNYVDNTEQLFKTLRLRGRET